jgi:GNAT superfamily N-acetyltransferase
MPHFRAIACFLSVVQFISRYCTFVGMSDPYATSTYATHEDGGTGALFTTSRLLVRPARQRDGQAIYAFAQANPEYEVMISGALPARDAYLQEFFESAPPLGMAYSELFKLLVLEKTPTGQAADEVVGLLDICADLRLKDVWHIGYFHVAARLQGTGTAQTLYEALEDWMASRGAQLLRLNVADANARARRFWQRNGYQHSHTKQAVPFGSKTHDMHTLLKPISTMSIAQYHEKVPQDRS